MRKPEPLLIVDTAPTTPNIETVDFLTRLYSTVDDGWLTLFAAHPDGRRTTKWAPTSNAADLAVDAAELAEWNVWFGCATRKTKLDAGRRGGKDDCASIPALWIDIDINGPGHASSRLPTEDEAYKLVNDFPIPPTVIINSGHGLQAWWALQEPHTLDGSDILARWGATWARRSNENGYDLDNVFDAPRVMRLPGTINTKSGCPPVPVTVEHEDWRNRYGIDHIDPYLDPAPQQPVNHIGVPYIGPDRPGDAYNNKHTTTELLTELGFVPGRVDRDGAQHWKWPNAAGDQSATTWPDGHCTIWSETAAKQLGVRLQHGYDPYGLYADTAHGGDHAAAAEHLANTGYGTPRPRLEELIPKATATTPLTPTVIDQALLDIISTEYGITGPEAWRLAEQLDTRIQYEKTIGIARRIIRDDQLERESDLTTITPINVAELLARQRAPRTPLFGDLLYQGHNATIVARWKVGKSTFVDNAAIAAASGGLFLGTFQTPQPLRVVIFNYELDEDDMTDRLNTYNIPSSALANIEIVNLRGRRLPLLTTKGRDYTVNILKDCGAQLWIVDPFGAAFGAAGGQDENSNAEVRRFLIGLDEIKRLAACTSMLMPVHTGRRVDHDGDEQGRGATVLEDWPDVRILLTRGQKEQRDYRFIRTEGRAGDLEESRLTYNIADSRLTLENTNVGVSRSRARDLQNAHLVRDVIGEEPGANSRRLVDLLADAGIGNNTEKSKAVTVAKQAGLIHFHRNGNEHRHYLGGQHPDDQPCTGGFTQ